MFKITDSPAGRGTVIHEDLKRRDIRRFGNVITIQSKQFGEIIIDGIGAVLDQATRTFSRVAGDKFCFIDIARTFILEPHSNSLPAFFPEDTNWNSEWITNKNTFSHAYFCAKILG